MKNQEAASVGAIARSGDHEALLDTFLDDHAQWQRWRTWSDETTHAVHESMCLRAELVHEPEPHTPGWRFAVYNSPVGARLWHAAASRTALTGIIDALLRSLATHAAEYPDMDSPGDAARAEATRPLAESGWTPAPEAPGWVRWRPANVAFFLRHDQLADSSTDTPAAWVLSGPDQHRARWTITLSATAPAVALADVTEALADHEALLRSGTAAPSPVRTPPRPPTAQATATVERRESGGRVGGGPSHEDRASPRPADLAFGAAGLSDGGQANRAPHMPRQQHHADEELERRNTVTEGKVLQTPAQDARDTSGSQPGYGRTRQRGADPCSSVRGDRRQAQPTGQQAELSTGAHNSSENADHHARARPCPRGLRGSGGATVAPG
ncbi:hypothetical protein [Streptomyces californicus]|uniref:hypothetical protein n=1 Tax=Streptomyces californicus TaxID=67351 RepID=UPI003787BFE2